MTKSTPLLLSGKEVAKTILMRTRKQVQGALELGQEVGLCVLQVGEYEASSIYVARKESRAQRIGFVSTTLKLPTDISEESLIEQLGRLNRNPFIHGILVQLPLPSHINEQYVLDTIDPSKDVDGFHPINSGLLSQGRPRFVPCTPKGVIGILKHYEIPLSGKHAVVIGRSNIVGRPMAQLLEQHNCTVTVCHSRTSDLKVHLSTADIVVAAVGIPNMVQGEWLKEGVVVIDVGINRLSDGSICGDVDFESASKVASAITPVPGGVGPTTIANLMENTWMAFQSNSKE